MFNIVKLCSIFVAWRQSGSSLGSYWVIRKSFWVINHHGIPNFILILSFKWLSLFLIFHSHIIGQYVYICLGAGSTELSAPDNLEVDEWGLREVMYGWGWQSQVQDMQKKSMCFRVNICRCRWFHPTYWKDDEMQTRV